MNLNKIHILILLFACVNYGQSNPTRRDIDIYKGNSHTLSFEAPYDVSSDSLLFVLKADRDDDTPRVIALRNTAGGGSDSEIEVIFSAVSTILVKLTQIHTEGLTAALYVYDLTIDSTTTLYTGYLKLRDEVAGSADGIATRTPYYTVATDTPGFAFSVLAGYDSDNSVSWLSKNAFQDSILTAITLAGKMVINADSVGIRGDLDVDGQTVITKTDAAQLIIKGWAEELGVSNIAGQLNIGGDSRFQGRILYDGTNGLLYIDNSFDDNGGEIIFRVKTAGTPIEAITIEGGGDVVFIGNISLSSIPSDSTGLNIGRLWYNSSTGAIHRKF